VLIRPKDKEMFVQLGFDDASAFAHAELERRDFPTFLPERLRIV
jgi:hypothetical protein